MTQLLTTHNIRSTEKPTRASLKARIAHLLRTAQQRTALARLSDAALRDIGLTHAQATTESRRPIWDVPAYWRN